MNENFKFDVFASYGEKTSSRQMTLPELQRHIQSDPSLSTLTTLYRQTHRRGDKQRSPLFAPAVLFNGQGKDDSCITELTGVGMADFDKLAPDSATAEERQQELARCMRLLRDDPHTLMAYGTMSGNGVRPIFAYELDATQPLAVQKKVHESVYTAVSAYYARLLGKPYDEKCKNASRLSGLAHDPHCYLNLEAKPFSREETARLYQEEKSRLAAQKKQRAALAGVERLFERTLRKEVEDSGATFQPGHHNDYVSRVGYLLNRFGISEQVATEWAVGRFSPDYPEAETASTIHSCYSRTEEHGTRAAKTAKADRKERPGMAAISDIKEWLAGQVRFRHNVITDQTEYQELAPEDAEGTDDVGRAQPDAPEQQAWGESTKKYLNTLICRMSEQTGMRVRKDDMECVVQSDFTPDYNPLTSYLRDIEQQNRLPVEVFDGGAVTIDGRDPIHELAQTVQVQGGEEAQRLWTEALRKWLVGAVAAWLNDKVVNEIILVLIGPQGTYKTTWFNYLMPPQLREYFLAKLNADINDRDAVIALSENAIICLEEIDSLLPKELNRLKAAVSARHTKERAAYERFKNRRPHVASFCGTGNNMQFLTDHTGNRRWMPFQVQSITPPQTLDYHHNEVFLQALLCLRHGYQYWLTPDDMQLQNDHNRAFEVPNVEQELVLKYFRKPHEGEQGKYINASDAIIIINPNNSHRVESRKLGRAFSALGFERRLRKGSNFYHVVEKSQMEIEDDQRATDNDEQPF